MIALIPARSGSKGIPDKNIIKLGDRHLLEWSVSAAKQSGLFPVVSTDSEKYAMIAQCQVIFRPPELCIDTSTDMDYLKHAFSVLPDDILVLLRPTTPFRHPERILEAIKMFESEPYATSLRSAHELREPPHKMFTLQGKWFRPFIKNGHRETFNLPRQMLPKVYNPNGYVDIVKRETIELTGTVYGIHILPFITEEVVEIDRQEDLDYARYLVNIR